MEWSYKNYKKLIGKRFAIWENCEASVLLKLNNMVLENML